MTCIIGLVRNGKVYMGGDSAAVSGLDVWRTAHPKVFRNGEFLIGYTTSFRMGQLLQFQLRPPVQDGERDAHAFMLTTFVNAVREVLKEAGYARVENNQESGGLFLVGYRGHLYLVLSEFSVLECRDPFMAIGCGESYAMAAMHALAQLSSRKRILKSLKITAHFSAGVTGPFHVLSLPRYRG